MKKIFGFFLFSVLLFAAALNEDLLYIEAKLYPKIMMLTQNLSNKSTIKIAVVSNNNTISLSKKYKDYFPHNKKFLISVIKKITLNYDVYIFTYTPKKEDIKKLIKSRKIIFTLLPNNVKNAMFGIYIGVRVYPYINPALLKEANIIINPIILKVGKIYEK